MAGWTRGPTIGRGTSAAVSLATLNDSGAVLAVKSAELANSALLRREYSILSSLSSPHIARCLGADVTCEAGGRFYNILMEYFPGGTLCDEIRRQGGRLSEREIRRHVSAVLRGLRYLHGIGVVHRDVKGSNLLMGSDGDVRIGDLGSAAMVDGDGATGGFAGTPLFMAPEVARGAMHGCAADVWALGCTVVEMATGRPPWSDIADPVSALYRIGCTDMVPEMPQNLSEQGKDFLSRCLRRNPAERPTAEQLLQHPFVGKFEAVAVKSAPISDSPKSILDHDLWNSVGTERSQTEIASTAAIPAPAAERLRALFSPTERRPIWSLGESWVRVRSNTAENFPVPNQNAGGESSEALPIASTSRREVNQDLVEESSSVTRNYVDSSSLVTLNHVEGENNDQFNSNLFLLLPAEDALTILYHEEDDPEGLSK
ncbi:Mitogen-activated protein kinase kinase kinase [Nymphaea thermarum]|nr:Mitogen-activated protein kinase kinase kinase [Nymphaea thermarum]